MQQIGNERNPTTGVHLPLKLATKIQECGECYPENILKVHKADQKRMDQLYAHLK